MISLKKNSYLALNLFLVVSLMQAGGIKLGSSLAQSVPSPVASTANFLKSSCTTDTLQGMFVCPLKYSPSNQPTYFFNQWSALQAKFNNLNIGQYVTIAIDESKGAQAITITFPDSSVYPYPLFAKGSPYQITVFDSQNSVRSCIVNNGQSIKLYKGQLETVLVLPDGSSIDQIGIISIPSNNNNNVKTLSPIVKSLQLLQDEWKNSNSISGIIDKNSMQIMFLGRSLAKIRDQLVSPSSSYTLCVVSDNKIYTLQVSANANNYFPIHIMTASEAAKLNINYSGTQAFFSDATIWVQGEIAQSPHIPDSPKKSSTYQTLSDLNDAANVAGWVATVAQV